MKINHLWFLQSKTRRGYSPIDDEYDESTREPVSAAVSREDYYLGVRPPKGASAVAICKSIDGASFLDPAALVTAGLSTELSLVMANLVNNSIGKTWGQVGKYPYDDEFMQKEREIAKKQIFIGICLCPLIIGLFPLFSGLSRRRLASPRRSAPSSQMLEDILDELTPRLNAILRPHRQIQIPPVSRTFRWSLTTDPLATPFIFWLVPNQ